MCFSPPSVALDAVHIEIPESPQLDATAVASETHTKGHPNQGVIPMFAPKYVHNQQDTDLCAIGAWATCSPAPKPEEEIYEPLLPSLDLVTNSRSCLPELELSQPDWFEDENNRDRITATNSGLLEAHNEDEWRELLSQSPGSCDDTACELAVCVNHGGLVEFDGDQGGEDQE